MHCTTRADLTCPGGSKGNISWDQKCTRRPGGERGAPCSAGWSRPPLRSKQQRWGQSIRRVSVCKMEIKRKRWRPWGGSACTHFILRALGFNQKEPQSYWSFLKATLEGPSCPRSQAHTRFLRLLAASAEALSHGAAVVCFPVWTNGNSTYLLGAAEGELRVAPSSAAQEATGALTF